MPPKPSKTSNDNLILLLSAGFIILIIGTFYYSYYLQYHPSSLGTAIGLTLTALTGICLVAVVILVFRDMGSDTRRIMGRRAKKKKNKP